jgi:hypothetical protein
MARNSIVPPPLREPVFGPGGQMTRAWQWYFLEVFRDAQMAEDTAVLQAMNAEASPDVDAAAQAALLSQQLQTGGPEALERLRHFEAGSALVGSAASPNTEQLRDALALMAAGVPVNPLHAELADMRVLLATMMEMQNGRPGSRIIADTHARKVMYPATSYPNGWYYETDRTVLYASINTDWKYVAGTMFGTLAPDTKPTDLGVLDTGFLFRAGDYEHAYVWQGIPAAWRFAPGDPGSRYIVGAGNWTSPTGGLWALCDTSIVQSAMPDGSLAAVQTPELNTLAFLVGGAAETTARVATAPTLAGSPQTETEAAHTHLFPTITSSTGGPDSFGSINVGDGSSGTASVPSNGHIHNFTFPPTPSGAGSAHFHAITAANLGLQAPSEALGGLPKRMVLYWFMRR